jgi:hypothetical protein
VMPTIRCSGRGRHGACLIRRDGRPRRLPRRSYTPRERKAKTVLLSDLLDGVDRTDRGAHRLSAQTEHEIHGEDDQPHHGRVAWVDEAVEALARAAESWVSRSQSGYMLITRSSVTMSAGGIDSANST